mmetsp:Transcript_101090/g.177979  ORF Transcript_101090/g.177979 Transcript_101090/m.177979 type:complete len:431 (+) Transcript_101090:2-1294(+)
MATVPCVFALITLQIIERVTDFVRERMISRDRIRDFFENKWDEQCEEAEDDALGLTLSVLAVNALRMAINGMSPAGRKCLPDQMQRETGQDCQVWLREDGRTNWQIAVLFLAGLICCVTLFFVRLVQDKIFPRPPGDDDSSEDDVPPVLPSQESGPSKQCCHWFVENVTANELVDRVASGVVVGFSMAFSWCIFHANTQLLMAVSPVFFGDEDNATTLALVLGLEATYICFMLIRVLDALSNLPDKYTPPAVDDSIAAVCDALALLIGFAWQQLFQESVDDAALTFRKKMGPDGPVLAKFVIGSMISVFIFTSYKTFTIPFIVKKGWEIGHIFTTSDVHRALNLLVAKGDHLAKRYQEELLEDQREDRVFRALPHDDAGALAEKNRELLLRIREAEEETRQIQQSLDNYGGDMLNSLEGICKTVTSMERE